MIRALLAFLACTSGAYAASYPVLTYSTYLRDGLTPNAIATDPAGNVYLGGTGIIDPANSMTGAMVVKLNPQTNQYFYVSFLNGQSGQVINAIAADAMGNAYVAGSYVPTQAHRRLSPRSSIPTATPCTSPRSAPGSPAGHPQLP
jgi:hypothetical protein